MAPPPPANKPLTERVLLLAQTLQFAWFTGHVALLLTTIRYGFSYISFNFYSSWAIFSYRTAFIAAATTYGIVVYKSVKSRLRGGAQKNAPLTTLLFDENVQYLIMSLVWLSSYQVPLALLPYSVYSIFHVATYTRTNIIPTFTPVAVDPRSPSKDGQKSASTPLADSIGRFVKTYYDNSMRLVAVLEIALWLRLLLAAFSFAKGTWTLFLVYSIFFRSRYSQSAFVQNAFHDAAARIDAVLANQNIPPQARQAWQALKQGTRQITELTDLRKYTGATQQVPKKAQ